MLKANAYGALLACLLFSPFAQAAPESAPSGGDAPIDQVVVEATKDTLVKLAREVRLAEFRFYDRYNKLNTRRDYAVNCRDEAPTGSRFTWTDCQPVFQDKAREAEGRAYVQALQSTSTTPDGGVAVTGTPGAPASAAIMAGRPGFQKNMIDVTRQNPDLAKLLNEYGALLKQYEKTYEKVYRKKAPTDEKVSASTPPVPSPAASSLP